VFKLLTIDTSRITALQSSLPRTHRQLGCYPLRTHPLLGCWQFCWQSKSDGRESVGRETGGNKSYRQLMSTLETDDDSLDARHLSQ